MGCGSLSLGPLHCNSTPTTHKRQAGFHSPRETSCPVSVPFVGTPLGKRNVLSQWPVQEGKHIVGAVGPPWHCPHRAPAPRGTSFSPSSCHLLIAMEYQSPHPVILDIAHAQRPSSLAPSPARLCRRPRSRERDRHFQSAHRSTGGRERHLRCLRSPRSRPLLHGGPAVPGLRSWGSCLHLALPGRSPNLGDVWVLAG